MTRNTAVPVTVLLVALAAGWLSPQSPDPSQTLAQEPAADVSSASDTAVLDVGKVLQGYKQFQGDLESLKAEVAKANQEVAVRQAEAESVAKELQGMQPGQPNFENKQLLLVRLQTELKQLVDRNRQQFVVREAGLYKQAYDQLRKRVSQFASEHGIRLVLRVNQGEVDARNPNAVLQSVNETVIYQNGLDITNEIIRHINSE